jgi:hypothetical protein
MVRSDGYLNSKNPTGQIASWLKVLAQYDFEIEHRAGHKHQNADSMSRRDFLSSACNHKSPKEEETCEDCKEQDITWVERFHGRNI